MQRQLLAKLHTNSTKRHTLMCLLSETLKCNEILLLHPTEISAKQKKHNNETVGSKNQNNCKRPITQMFIVQQNTS